MLKIENLAASHGGKVRALHGVSLSVEAGEIVTLIGANGSGKSTLLKVVSGLLSSEQGSVIFEGRDLRGKPPHEVAALGIAHVPEGRRVFPRLSVLENLEMGAYFRKDKEIPQDIQMVFQTFPLLGERRAQLAGTLSGGEQQMLAMGRALMGRSRLLMLDEPSMGLAPVMVEKIFDTIRRINKQGITILLVEQNAYAALSVASRGYVMETGRIVLKDDAHGLLANDQIRKAYLGVE